MSSDQSGLFILRIRDDGIGLPAGMDAARIGTLGLQLVNILVAQIDGRMEVINDYGIEFRIYFRELKYRERS